MVHGDEKEKKQRSLYKTNFKVKAYSVNTFKSLTIRVKINNYVIQNILIIENLYTL